MPIPHLSQELVDSILDHLRDDVGTLTKCALVSHSFLPTAQRHLFSTLDLEASPQGIRTCERLLRALTLRSHLVQYIEALNLQLYWANIPGNIRNQNAILPLINILSMIPQIHSIFLRGCNSSSNQWASLPVSLKQALITCLQHQSLSTASITGIQGFPLSILMSCRGLKNLAIEGVVTSTHEHGALNSTPFDTIEPCGHLEVLSGGEWESGAGSTRALIAFLTHPRSMLRLTHLKDFAAAVRVADDCISFQQVINLAAGSLEGLTLSIHCQASTPPEPISIAPLTHLRRLAVTVFEDLSSPRWLLSFLATVPSINQIQEIALTVLFSNFHDRAWDEIDHKIATAPPFSGVHTVTLRYWRNHGQYRRPERRFQCCADKGVLFVFCEGDLVFPVQGTIW